MRLDQYLAKQDMTQSRSQAENFVRLGMVKVNGKVAKKAGIQVSDADKIILEGEQYVSRAALKLASIAKQFKLDFRDTTVLDVGSSTGGFTDYALQHGAKKVYAVDVGTDQLHPKLRMDERIELHEKTNILDVRSKILDSSKQHDEKGLVYLDTVPDIVVADVSFVSLRALLPSISNLVSSSSNLVIMMKPQFEAGREQTNKGVVKNSKIRRQIIKDFEAWLSQNNFKILDKADSQVAGSKGNVERFYLLKLGPGRAARDGVLVADRPAR